MHLNVTEGTHLCAFTRTHTYVYTYVLVIKLRQGKDFAGFWLGKNQHTHIYNSDNAKAQMAYDLAKWKQNIYILKQQIVVFSHQVSQMTCSHEFFKKNGSFLNN